MQEKIELIKNDGTKNSIDLISLFNVDIAGNKKEFILLSANEIDQNGLIKIMAAEVHDGKLDKITDQNDWTVVKNVMRSIISSSKGDYTYINPGDVALSFVVSDDFARVIAVQESAKAQLEKDYNESKPAPVATQEEAPQPVADPNSVIYPKTDETPTGEEVSPGIAEVNSIDPSKETEDFPQEFTNDFTNNIDITNNNLEEPSVQNVPEETQSSNIAPESSEESTFDTSAQEQVSNIEPAPLKDIVNNEISNDEVNPNDSARQILIDKIMSAVDEYIETTTHSKESLEITALKTSIKTMQEELNEMANALNTQE